MLADIIQDHQASQQLLKLPMKKHPVMEVGVRKLLLTMKMRIRRFLTIDVTTNGVDNTTDDIKLLLYSHSGVILRVMLVTMR